MPSVIPQKRALRGDDDDDDERGEDGDTTAPAATASTHENDNDATEIDGQPAPSDAGEDHDDEPGPDAQLRMDIDGVEGEGQEEDVEEEAHVEPQLHSQEQEQEGDQIPDASAIESLSAQGLYLQTTSQPPPEVSTSTSPPSTSTAETLALEQSLAASVAAATKTAANLREKSARTKKDSLKKRESKAAAVTFVGGGGPGAGTGVGTTPSIVVDAAVDSGKEKEKEKEREREKEKEKEKEKEREREKEKEKEKEREREKEKDKEKPKKGGKDTTPEEPAPLRYPLGAPKQSDFDAPRGPVFSFHHGVTAPDGTPIEFYETSEHVHNKRNFRYTHCIADPTFPNSMYYRHTEPEPYGPHMSFEDSAASVFFDRTAHHVTTDKGFRTARSNVCIREGRWFWECRVTRGVPRQLKKDGVDAAVGGGGSGGGGGNNISSGSGAANNGNTTTATATVSASSSGVKVAPAEARGHVRVGFARREAPLEAPVGFDAYSYGIRDVAGQKVWLSRPRDFFPPGEDLREGDVLGLEIQLPSEQLQRKVLAGEYNPVVDNADEEPDIAAEAPNIVRDRIPIQFKAILYFEKIDYHPIKELEDLTTPAPLTPNHSAPPQQRTLSSPSSLPPSPLHPVPSMRTLPNSFIRVYRNGVLMGTAFENLLAFLPPASQPQPQPGAREGLDDGMLGYYPAVSVFRGGAAEVNFGPRFWYPPPGYEEDDDEVDMVMDMLDDGGGGGGDDDDEPMDGVSAPGGGVGSSSRAVVSASGGGDGSGGGGGATSDFFATVKPVSQRFAEQVAEDVYYDILDEVDFWARDGMPDHAGLATADKTPRIGVEAGAGVIKELVQDD